MIDFTVPGKPQGKARARTFYDAKRQRYRSHTPDNTVLYENLIMACYLKAANEAGYKPYINKEPIYIKITAYYEIAKSTSKKDRAKIEAGKLLPVKKPDIDNICKVICDALNGVAYQDDAQIVKIDAAKAYAAAEPYVAITIKTAQEAQRDD